MKFIGVAGNRQKAILETGATDQVRSVLQYSLAFMDRWGMLILIALAMVAILWGLGETSLLDWDESVYAQVAREMIQSGDWVNLQQGYEPYFEKPPLLMWSIALTYKLLGVNEFAARLPSAISGVLLVAVTYMIGKSLYGPRTGFLAGCILLSSFGYVFQSRNGTTNIPLTLFVFVGIYAYQRLRNTAPQWWYLFFASFALAFMIKFWAALLLPLVVAIMILMEGKLREALSTNHFWLGLLLAMLVVVPWHVLAYLEHGQAFIDAYVTRNLIQRTFTPMDGHYGSPLYYVDVLRKQFSPWFFLIPVAVAESIHTWINQERKSDILLILTLSTFGLYTFVVHTKLQSYILPMFPALAILIAQLFVSAASKPYTNQLVHYLLSTALIATLIAQNTVLILFSVIVVALFLFIRLRILSKSQLTPMIGTLIFLGFTMIGTLDYVRENNRLGTWSLYGIPDWPVSQIAAVAGKHHLSTRDPLVGYFPQDSNVDPYAVVQGPAATFYSNRHVIVVDSWEQLVKQMSSQGSGEVLIAETYLDSLSADFDLAVVETVHPLAYVEFHQK